jgi:hypothetical protein
MISWRCCECYRTYYATEIKSVPHPGRIGETLACCPNCGAVGSFRTTGCSWPGCDADALLDGLCAQHHIEKEQQDVPENS